MIVALVIALVVCSTPWDPSALRQRLPPPSRGTRPAHRPHELPRLGVCRSSAGIEDSGKENHKKCLARFDSCSDNAGCNFELLPLRTSPSTELSMEYRGM